MFAIYGTSGLMYRGPMEDLRKVAPALRASRSRALQPDLDRTLPQPPSHESGADPERRVTQALTAYGQVQKPLPVRKPLQTVAEVMTAHPITVPADATVRQGWWTLYDHGIGQAAVVDERGDVMGLLSRAELMQPDRLPRPDGLALAWLALMSQPVTEVMITPVPCATPETDLRRLARVLLDTGLQGLPVVGPEGQNVGFVTRSDILKALVHDPPLDLWVG
jgi:CBS domain-containing protein